MNGVRILVLSLAAALPISAFAFGGHDGVGCNGCHGIHTAKGDVIFAVAPNKVAQNPRTKAAYTGSTALCLGCHEETSKGGQGYAPVSGHMSHPYGLTSVNPKVANVPGDLLRDGRFECVGCHDPHPSNANYKYLRVDTAKGQSMDAFCAVCHSAKADGKVVAKKAVVFTSMDQRAGGAAPAAAAPAKPAAAPAKK
ncbi:MULTISPECIES: cytochrome c3 family protein [Anaeromyxobacter]|uniref:cytochrome c3 family protein n=1 Tax=Anaeromyxobacter TaxID=161492 RepID=UPI001F5693E0|nr:MULTISPECIES: cytochrome c3 family protein [unclassified Anaeromyxobacter]